ncbi:hypothetical protein Tco_0080060 [Tanacetum coccineum]
MAPMVWDLFMLIYVLREIHAGSCSMHSGPRSVVARALRSGAIATQSKVSTGDTPFSLVYGTEAVIPAEIGMPTIRTAEVNIATNDDERRYDLDSWRLHVWATSQATRKTQESWDQSGKGPYEVTGRLGKGAYKRCMEGSEVAPHVDILQSKDNAIFREVLTRSAHGARLTNLESKLLAS